VYYKICLRNSDHKVYTFLLFVWGLLPSKIILITFHTMLVLTLNNGPYRCLKGPK